MRPTITKQLFARFVDPRQLKPSPRNYNPSICELNGRTWMAYRSHRMERDGRCGIALCELVVGPDLELTVKSSHWLPLGGATGHEHHEDPRLFLFRGKLHVAYSETTFPRGRPYIAVQKYARLEHSSSGWKVAEVFRPRYGDNHAERMEKNWQFFDVGGRLHAIYAAAALLAPDSTGMNANDRAPAPRPEHIVIELDGDRVVREHRTPGVTWPWGEIRGGTPPLRVGDRWLTFFHSSTPAAEGAWRRYWMGAYYLNDDFTVTSITKRPIAGGSEDDDHGHDPRTESSWKPYVVFPGGAIATPLGYLVAMGINDWRIAIGYVSLDPAKFAMPGAPLPPRFFHTKNGARPVRMMQLDRTPVWLDWERKPSQIGGAPGFAKIEDPWMAEEISLLPGVTEVSSEQFARRIL